MLLMAALLLANCSGPDAEVDWPELKALDNPSAKAEGLAKKKQAEALRALLPEVTAAAAAVTEASLPKNAQNPETVKEMLGDLADLTAKAQSPGDLEDEDLFVYGAAFHSLVAKLMKESGVPHIHEGEGPNSGFLHPLETVSDGNVIGQIEIKLHDDAGDIEVWLTRGQTSEQPLDVPLDTVIGIDFPELENRSVELQVRNKEANEGEDGVGNIRDGKTNYFLFPGETGADASWLMGAEFAAKVVVTFSADGVDYQSAFDLKPHVH